MRVLLDLDATVVDIYSTWLELHLENTGETLTVDDLKCWGFDQCSKTGHKIYEALWPPGTFLRMKPLDGALEAVEKLAKNPSNEIVVVTSAMWQFNYSEKVAWVAKHLQFVKRCNVVLLPSAADAPTRKDLIPADVLIDDAPHVADAYRRAYPDAKILGIEHPYNTGCASFDLLARGWRDPREAWSQILACVEGRPDTFTCLHCGKQSGKSLWGPGRVTCPLCSKVA